MGFFLLFFFFDSMMSANKDNFLSFFFFLGAAPVAYGVSRARGHIGAATASVHHSHSNTGSADHGNAGSLTHAGQGLNLHPHGYESGS